VWFGVTPETLARALVLHLLSCGPQFQVVFLQTIYPGASTEQISAVLSDVRTRLTREIERERAERN
jgi:hypothetical protein